MTCRNAKMPQPGALRGARMQAPSMAYVVHAVPGDAIEIALVIGGKRSVVAVGDRLALDIAADLTRAVASNMGDGNRRSLCALPGIERGATRQGGGR
jgi:hypothetical protein